LSATYQTGDELIVRIEKIVPRGYGLGFAERLTVMTALAAPGDLVRVRLTDVKKRLAFAEITEVLEPGKDRQKPPCKYFGTCGGCNFQQMTPAAQRQAKIAIIEDCLKRIGKIDVDGEIGMVASPLDLGYRSRARWHFQPGRLGYLKRDSHEVVDVDVCPIITGGLQGVLDEVRRTLESGRALSDRGEVEGASSDFERSVYSDDLAELDTGLTTNVGRWEYSYSAHTFFQANRTLLAELIGAAVGGTSGGSAFDLYSGVGLFTLPLAEHFAMVTAVEAGKGATKFARLNVARAGLKNVTIEARGVKEFLAGISTGTAEFILLDPPRSGTEDGVIEDLARLAPKNISYVSCEPSILARDLRKLLDSGYAIESITAVDLFPQTHHVETVVRMSLRSG
jgi:23S rRNA (uracil1939-C5)-methyltransferase